MADKDEATAPKIIHSMNATFTLDALTTWPIKQSILLVGDHGVGKDGIIKTAAQIQNCPCVDIRLSQNDVGDIKGMPFLVKGRTVFAPPDWMPFEEGEEMELDEMLGKLTSGGAIKRASSKYGYLFFNEINRATREVQQCAFEPVLDRTLNNRRIRENWRIVSAINGDEHYQVNLMDIAFKSRFYIIRFRPTVEEWLAWAAQNAVHPVIYSFIQRHKEMLDPTEELLNQAESDAAMQVQNRRAWTMLSDTIKERETLADQGKVPQPIAKDSAALEYLMLMAIGYVGSLAAIQLRRYVETDYESLSGEIILNKWSKEVAGKITVIVGAGRVVEISRYNEMIVSYVQGQQIKVLAPEQKKNLTAYFKILPKEMRADFWKIFMGDAKTVCLDWYSDKAAQALVVEALQTPGTQKFIPKA